MNKRKLGTIKEQLAEKFLEKQGVSVIDRNFRTRIGEIDLIGIKNQTLIFFEVKYRKTEKYGFPAEAVNYKKQLTISRVSDQFRFLKCKELTKELYVRYDVIVILGEHITWIKNAFPYQGCGWY